MKKPRPMGAAGTVDKAVKVFARLFQKAAQSRARSPRLRRPQTAKPSYRRFLFAKLFLCAYMVKEKASFGIVLFWGVTPFVYSLRASSEKPFFFIFRNNALPRTGGCA